MGLDVLIYDKNDKKINTYEITEALHNEIFNSKKLWRSYLELRKISDYYLSDATFEGQALNGLITDLEKYKMYINENNQGEICSMVANRWNFYFCHPKNIKQKSTACISSVGSTLIPSA